MMVLRWLYFAIGTVGWSFISVKIWRGEGWFLGLIISLTAFIYICEWLEKTMLKQWKMKKIVTYEEVD